MRNAFIRIEPTLELAMQTRISPQMEFFSFKGIQLLPNNPLPYIQRTFANGGLELENPLEILLYDICGNEVLEDITPYFEILNIFQDPETGFNQIEWQLQDIPFDAGNRLVYMRFRQGVNVFFYSSPFVLTADNSEYTSRWDYKDTKLGTMYSTQLTIWFKQLMDLEDITSYDQLDGRRVGMNSKLIPYEVWQTSIVDINLFHLFKQMRQSTYVYCDLAKTVPFEPFETPKLVGKENFGEAEITLCRDETNAYNPLYVAPTPPPPPVDPPTITLISVASVGTNSVEYTFTYENFSPLVLTLQYSLDQITWTSNTGSVNSPRTNTVPSNQSNDFYYRVTDLASGTVSNVLQLPVRSITITNVTSSEMSFNVLGNKYKIFFTLNNFIPNSALSWDISTDGTDDSWIPAYYSPANVSPKDIGTPSSGLEFKYFRMRYNPLGIVSNTYNFEY